MSTEVKGVQLPAGKKLGLALSGGGFRGAFFHVGVLAQIARQGLLRHVEAISTVSGGSIIGALYYLHVKNLLESKPDAEIDDEDYVRITVKIEADFLKGVQQNLRCLAFADPIKNWKMRRQDYSVSDRLGELYDEYFYRPVANPKSTKMVQMKDLKILPMLPEGKRADEFDPKEGNASRRTKIPILLINSTALNCGHNWRFEAARMGEPPWVGSVECDVDKNLRLVRPPSYDKITVQQQDFELGLAVAASSCVPGLFHPLAVSDLYQGVRIQLVDGGVHDNQGIEGLLEAECNLLIVSDACGQMADDDDPGTWFPAVAARTSSILMDRVREEQLFRLLGTPGREVAFFHLREELTPRTVPWVTVGGLPFPGPYPACSGPQDTCSFGVKVEVQDLLSQVRTDLDSFTEVEASTLMLDGYLISEKILATTTGFRNVLNPQNLLGVGHWNFLRMKPWIGRPTKEFLHQLRVSKFTVFKVFWFYKWLLILPAVLGFLLIWVLFFSKLSRFEFGFSVRGVSIAIIIAAVGFLLPRISRIFAALKFLRSPIQSVASLVGQSLIPIAASLFFWLHLKLFDPLYLRKGKIDRLS